MFLLMPYGSNAINMFIHVVNMPNLGGGGGVGGISYSRYCIRDETVHDKCCHLELKTSTKI